MRRFQSSGSHDGLDLLYVDFIEWVALRKRSECVREVKEEGKR
jgi:hypothetical protein